MAPDDLKATGEPHELRGERRANPSTAVVPRFRILILEAKRSRRRSLSSMIDWRRLSCCFPLV
jgi:hypothetical protein